MSQGTCQQEQGWLCTVFGLETSYDTTIACCNRLIQMLNSNMQLVNSEGVSLGDVVQGACACRHQGDVQEATTGVSIGRAAGLYFVTSRHLSGRDHFPTPPAPVQLQPTG